MFCSVPFLIATHWSINRRESTLTKSTFGAYILENDLSSKTRSLFIQSESNIIKKKRKTILRELPPQALRAEGSTLSPAVSVLKGPLSLYNSLKKPVRGKALLTGLHTSWELSPYNQFQINFFSSRFLQRVS